MTGICSPKIVNAQVTRLSTILLRFLAVQLIAGMLVLVGCSERAEIPPGTGKQILDHGLLREDGRAYVMEPAEFVDLGEQYVDLYMVIHTLDTVFERLEMFVDRLEWAVNRNRIVRTSETFAEWHDLAVDYRRFIEETDWMHLVSDEHLEQAAETVESIEAFRSASMPILENLPSSVRERITVGSMLSAYDERPQLSLDFRLEATIDGYHRAVEDYREGSH